MGRKQRTSPWIVVPAALALAYAIAVVVAAWRAPDKGFLAFTGHRVIHVDDGGVADRAGLRVGDVIASVDGAPVTSTLDYSARVLTRVPGDRVVLGVVRGDQRFDVAIGLGPSPPPWAAIAATVLAAILLVLGLVARIGRPADPAARRFHRTTVVYAIVYTGALSWTHLVPYPLLGLPFLLALFLSPAIALDLALDFAPLRPGDAPARRRWRIAVYAINSALLAGATVALAVAASDDAAGRGDRALPWAVGFIAAQMLFIIVQAGVGLAAQWRALRDAHGPARAQLRWLLFGSTACLIPSLLALPVAASDLQLFLLVRYKPFVVATALLWFVSYGLAVLRIRLPDADALIRSSLGYALTTGAAIAVYVAIVLAAGWLTGRLVGGGGPWPSIAAAIAAAALFGPIRTRVGRWLDRRFFRDRAHYVEALRRVSESLARLREPAELAREATEQVVAAVRAEHGALVLRADRPDAPEPLDDGVVVPVGDQGWLVLGPRRSGDLYSSEDRDLLGALAGQLTIALGNARLYGTIAVQNEEIRALRDRLEDENRFLRARVEAATEGATLVGDSKPVKELTRAIERVARADASVLILGESGTGKGLVARTIHAASPRAAGPFLHVDCGAIAASVFESELFGHERGAFTGASRLRRGPVELADGGTLFLDEIGELPLELQPKLLRVIEERSFLRVGGTAPVTVDVRILAATHRKLDDMVARGEFREDLYFRLRVVELTVPPLRARRGDLPALCASLVPRVARRAGRRTRPVSADALARMATYGWPGNVRELENVIERALVLGDGAELTAADLDLPDRPPPPEEPSDAADLPHDAVMEDIERRRLVAALRASGGNQSHAARSLGMPRTTFINKLRRHGLV